MDNYQVLALSLPKKQWPSGLYVDLDGMDDMLLEGTGLQKYTSVYDGAGKHFYYQWNDLSLSAYEKSNNSSGHARYYVALNWNHPHVVYCYPYTTTHKEEGNKVCSTLAAGEKNASGQWIIRL